MLFDVLHCFCTVLATYLTLQGGCYNTKFVDTDCMDICIALNDANNSGERPFPIKTRDRQEKHQGNHVSGVQLLVVITRRPGALSQGSCQGISLGLGRSFKTFPPSPRPNLARERGNRALVIVL